MRRTIVLLVLLTASGSANVQGQSPSFEVAVIKPNTGPPQATILSGLRNGRFTAVNVTLKQVLAAAYGMTQPRIIGPDWLERGRFDFAATAPKDVAEGELKPMLQALLKDRFKLVAHPETREMPVYYLRVAKGGAKMHVYSPSGGARNLPQNDPNMRGFPMMRGTATASGLADQMAAIVGRPVIDDTGLVERYDYVLSFAPLSPMTGNDVPEFSPPSLFTAVQKELGLRLDAGRDRVKVIVIDSMERIPTEN